MLHAPGGLLRNGVPGQQATERLALGRLGIEELGRVPAGARLGLARSGLVELPFLVVHQVDGHVLRRQIHQARLGIEGHGVPVVRAIWARHRILGLAAVARCGNADGLAVLVVAAGPVHGHEVLGRDELSIGAIEHEEEAVLGRMQYDLARLAGDLDVGQDHGLGGGVVPVVARCFLIVPLVFAGVGIQRHDGSQVQVVAALGAAHLVRPGRAIARAHIHGVEFGIESHAVPHGAAATGLPPFAAGVPGPGGALHGLVLEGFGRIAGYAEPAPFLLAGLGVIGRDIAAHAIFGTAVADDDLALEHARRAGDGQRPLLPLEGILVPDLLAGGGVQGDQAAIPCTHIDLALPQRHAAVDDVAAPLEAGAAVDLRVIGPDPVAGAGVDGMHHAP